MAMSANLKRLLNQEWEYRISRNLPVWHDSLSIIYGKQGFAPYHLPPLRQLRIHHGFHSDFYAVKRSNQAFKNELAENLEKPNYLDFLKKKYRQDGKNLLKTACHISENRIGAFFRQYGLAYSMLDLTAVASKLITDKLSELLPKNKESVDIIAYYSRPKLLAPIQKMEKELRTLSIRKADILRVAKRLYGKYRWIPVNFMGEPWDLDYFVERIRSRELRQELVIKKPRAKISPAVLFWLKALREITDLNEYRKAIFTQVNFTIRPLFSRLAAEYGLKNWKNISLFSHAEILALIAGKDIKAFDLLAKREKPFIIYTLDFKKTDFLYGPAVTFFEKRFQGDYRQCRQFSGTIACSGKAIGKAKIIFEPEDFRKFNKGDILAAKMTSVDFIPIMKKAGAFITDEGGLACHAAVVAREYHKPCVVGTKIATKVLKDGDLVEVDAYKGTVRKI